MPRPRPMPNGMPNFVACHFLADLVPPTAEVLLDAFLCAKDRSLWRTPPYRKLPKSRPSQCWRNVERAIALWGGTSQLGWSYHLDPIEGQKNCMADIEAIPHAVWRSPSGELFEISADYKDRPFMPSDVVQPYMALNVGFMDDHDSAATYRPTNPFLACRTLTAALRLAQC